MAVLEALDIIGRDVWREAAEDYYALRLARATSSRPAPKGVQRFLNDILEKRFNEAGWVGSEGRFVSGKKAWVRITFRHQMSLGSDLIEALKVHRREKIDQVAIMAASARFLAVISPNDAAALVSFEKLRIHVMDLIGVFDIPLFIGKLDQKSSPPPEVRSTLERERPRDRYVSGEGASS